MADKLSPAIDGCTCLCHRQVGVRHFMACCGLGSIPKVAPAAPAMTDIPLKVEQCDRELYISIGLEEGWSSAPCENERIREGQRDGNPVMQMLARHRLNDSTPAAAPLPEEVGAVVERLRDPKRRAGLSVVEDRRAAADLIVRLSTDRDSVIEECAKVADDYPATDRNGAEWARGFDDACLMIAAQIRARKSQ